MAQRPKRRFYTAAESAEIWDRWRRGEGLWTIARAFGKSSSSIYSHISLVDFLEEERAGESP